MLKHLLVALILTSNLVLFPVLANVDVSGVWQHASKPALIDFDLKLGLAKVKQHDDNSKAEGLTVIKNIKPVSGAANVWSGDMYNGYIDSYVKVSITLVDDSTLVVSDEAETEVLRLVRG
jgi:hypothetical protein